MKTSLKQKVLTGTAGLISALLIAATFMISGFPEVRADDDRGPSDDRHPGRDHRRHPRVVPPNERYQGRTYAEWSAKWLEWIMEYPVDDPAHPHPYLDPDFHDVRAFQDFDDVWFIAGSAVAPEITLTIPKGKALFFPINNVDVSSLEAPPFFGLTKAEQRAKAKFFADHIVNPAVTIDGVAVGPINLFRVMSPQFRFDAPTPWIAGIPPDFIGGRGTAVGDGYYILLEPLPKGEHTIHTSSTIHFEAGEAPPEWGPDPVDAPFDFTFHLNVK